jgi:hypothetical protein
MPSQCLISPAPAQFGESVGIERFDGLEEAEGHIFADHRGGLQQALRHDWEPIDSSCQDHVHRWW